MIARRRRRRPRHTLWLIVLPLLVVLLALSANHLRRGISFRLPQPTPPPVVISQEQPNPASPPPTANPSPVSEKVAGDVTPSASAPGDIVDTASLFSAIGGSIEDERLAEPTPTVELTPTLALTPTPIPTPRRIITYTVQAGDSVWSIASRFDLDIETLRWSNPALTHNPDVIWPGQVLTILPVRGAYHTVKGGETLEGIASVYGVDPAVIVAEPLNGLTTPVVLQPGQQLVIPGGSKDIRLPKPPLDPGYTFAWPLWGVISQGYHSRHHAIDIAGPYDTPVYAAASGRILFSAFSDVGYGYMVKIDHGDGLVAIYGHLKGDYVAVGDWVQRGQMIGRLGSTGNSTGPHLHFEVRRNGAWVNPLTLLPPR